jgi:hypothetical protein
MVADTAGCMRFSNFFGSLSVVVKEDLWRGVSPSGRHLLRCEASDHSTKVDLTVLGYHQNVAAGTKPIVREQARIASYTRTGSCLSKLILCKPNINTQSRDRP